MNKLFTKIVGAALGLTMAIGVGVAVASSKEAVPVHAASPASYTFTSNTGFTSSSGTFTDTDSNTWNYTRSDTKYSAMSGDYLQLGSKNNPDTPTFSTSGISGTITSVSVDCWSYNGAHKLTIQVGSTKYKDAVATPSASGTTTTGTGSSSGTITISFTNAGRAMYIKSISVAYSSGPVELPAPTNLVYDSNTQKVSWDAVSNASSYQYSYDNSTYTATGNSGAATEVDVSSLTKDVQATIYVKAIGDGSSYSTSSAASLSFTPTATPTYSGVVLTKGSLTGSYKGSAYIQCSAEVQGANNPSQSVTWYLTSTNTYGTTTSVSNVASIDSNGKVTFLDNTNGVYVWALAADGSTHNSTGLEVSASGLGDAPGAESNPYTVAQAFDAIDNSGNVTGVYATGIVSSIYTAWSTQFNNISFYISDDGTTSGNQLEAFRAVSGTATLTEADNIKVGDIVTVAGNLTKYNSTYEFAAACTVEVRKHISSVAVTTAPTKTTYDAGEEFAPAGLVVTATYDDSSTKTYSYASVASLFAFDKTTLVKTDTSVAITMFGQDTDNAYKTTQTITVNAVAAVLSVTVSPSSLSLDIGDSDTLSVDVEVDAGAAQTVNWSSSNTNVATVDANGEVTAVARGSATITATSTFDNTKSDDCVVTVTDPNINEYTWDLTTDSYSSASSDEVVWSTTGITAKTEKVSGTTPANNYVPASGNSNNHTRFLYSGHTLSFVPDTSYSISSIQITLTTEGYATTVAGLTWTNATASSSGTVVTIVPTDGTISVSAAGSSAVRATLIYVEYTHDTSTKSLDIEDSSLVIAVGANVSTNLVETNYNSGTYEADTNACATVSISGTTVTVTGVTAGSYTFTITETNYSLEVELTVTVYDPSLYYGKINQSSDIVPGDRFIIKANGYDKAFGGVSSSLGQTVDISDNVKNDGANIDSYELSEDAHIFTLIGSSSANKYYLYDITGNYFLVGSEDATTTSTNASLANATEWTITVSNGIATIASSESRSLMYNYNNGNDRFACYQNNQTALNLYKISGSSLKDNLNTFQNNSLKMDSYDVGGTHGSTGGNGSCESYYLPAKAAFNDLSEAEQQLFKTSSEYSAAKQRYEDWATANRDGAPYDGNDDIQTLLSARVLPNIIGTGSNTVAIIVIISMISITATGGYFFIRKRKEQ